MATSNRAVKSKKEMRREQRQNWNKARKEASKRKMLDALANLEFEFASFSNWLAESGFARSHFNNLMFELIEEREVQEVIFVGSHSRYRLTKLPNSIVFEHLSTTFLNDLLEKVRTSTTNREEKIAEFNRYLGSLIAYVLKSHDEYQAQEILKVVLLQVQSYLNYPETFMGQPLTKKEPNVESVEWRLWRDIDSRNYVTTIEVPRGSDGLVKRQKKPQHPDIKLPCSGRCICDKVSNGCMNRLIEAKLKDRSATETMLNLINNKNQKRETIVRIEAIDGAKFSKKWLNGE